MLEIPTIETERLILRPHRLSDLDDCVALSRDEAVVRYISGVPSTREQTWVRVLRWVGMWHFLGYGFLVVEEKESGRYVGEAGFQEMHRDMEPSIEGTLEAGWVLSTDAQGRGYGTEAMNALIAWAEARFPGKTMSCIIDPRNEPSLRLATKLGFREVTRTDYNNSEITVLLR